jgi:putative lipoprotein
MVQATCEAIADVSVTEESGSPEACPPRGRRSLSSPRLRRRPLRTTLSLALIVAVVVACAAPATLVHADDDLFGRDKALHFGVSAGLALGGYGGAALFTESPPPRLAIGGGIALFAGIAKELSDRHTGGDPSLRDLGWDIVGTATGLAFAWLVDRWW